MMSHDACTPEKTLRRWFRPDPRGLSQPGMSDGVLDLFALRPRAALLQRDLPHGSSTSATPRCQPAPPGIWRAGSIMATGNVPTGNVTRRLA